MKCSVAATLAQIGERWTILILREAFWGTRRFETFQRNLGIARNILSDRLRRLTADGILQRVPLSDGGKRAEYHLTAKGHDLFRVLIALQEWGDRWLQAGQEPIRTVVRATGEPIGGVAVLNRQGQPLAAAELGMEPGPGADADIRRRLAEDFSPKDD